MHPKAKEDRQLKRNIKNTISRVVGTDIDFIEPWNNALLRPVPDQDEASLIPDKRKLLGDPWIHDKILLQPTSHL